MRCPDKFIHALDAATGEPLWTYQAAPVSTGPMVTDGAVFADTEDGQVFAVGGATGGNSGPWPLSAADCRR